MKVDSINQRKLINNNYAKPSFGNVVVNNIPKNLLKNKNNIYIISGPSGVGKDTILNAFNEKFNNFFTKVVTSTTRQPRVGEIDGISYNFLTADEFQKGIKNNEFLEYVNVFADKYYGTRLSDVEKVLQEGKNPILVIDVDGAQKIKSKLKNVIAIFIKPKSMDTLKAHLEKRGSETAETMKTRLQRAAYEVDAGLDPKRYDAVIQNNSNIEENVNDLKQILNL